jgi:hypothetical protein
MDPHKQLEIIYKSFQRTSQDLRVYQQEIIQQNARIQKLQDQKADSHDIKKQQEVLQEIEQMIPITEKNIAEWKGKLQVFITENACLLEENEFLHKAQQVLNE